jgi:hypothetical protein
MFNKCFRPSRLQPLIEYTRKLLQLNVVKTNNLLIKKHYLAYILIIFKDIDKLTLPR